MNAKLAQIDGEQLTRTFRLPSCPSSMRQASRTPVVRGGPSHLPTDCSYAPVPAVGVGETCAFQAWYRDGPTSNFTESKHVMFMLAKWSAWS